MGMDMVGYTGTGYFAGIGPNIETAGTKCLPKHPDTLCDKLEVLVELFE